MKIKISLSNKIFFIFISVVVVAVGIIAWYGYNNSKNAYIESAYKLNTQRVRDLAFKIQEELAPIVSDVSYISNSYALDRYMIWKGLHEYKKTKKWEQIFSDSLLDLLKTKKKYYQFRILDLNANEAITATYNKNSKTTQLKEKSQLQNKAGRAYATVPKRLSKGQFYISDINLNVEHSKIEKPFRPILRYATPLINANKELIGIFVANYYADIILDIIDKVKEKNKGVELYLLDKDTNYIYHENKEKRWNKQLKNGFSFKKDFFDISELHSDKKILIRNQKIYSIQKVYPSKKHKENYWYIVSAVDTKIALVKLEEFKLIFYIVLLVIFLLSFIIIKLFVSKLITPLEKVTKQLKALSLGQIEKENISYNSDDEIGEIVKSTAKVVDAIETTIKQAKAVSNGDFLTDIKLLSDKDSLGLAISSMTKRLSDIAIHANSIAHGDFSHTIEVKSPSDKLGKSLLLMNNTLRDNQLKNDADIWFSNGISNFSENLAGVNSLEDITKQALSFISKHIDADSSVMYLFNSTSNTLEYAQSYAYEPTKDKLSLNIDDGLISQVASEKKPKYIKDIKNKNFIIKSAMGNIVVSELYIVPMLYENELYGVIEFANVNKFSDLHIRYINRVSEILAVTMQSTNKNIQIQSLLKESEKSYKDLSRASEYKSEFLANMSHELRTPLNSIILLSKLLVKNVNDTLNESDMSKIAVINRAGNDLLLLINDILDLSKIESGNVFLEEQKTHTGDIVDELKGLFDVVAAEKGIKFNISDNFEDSFVVDNIKLLQVLKNLLSNAFKFTKRGWVNLNITKDDRELIFEVNDSGIGMPEDKLSLIFEAFKQVDGSISRKYGGTGLGLSISKTFVDMMSGKIVVSSQDTLGSSFKVILPLKQHLDKAITVKENMKSSENNDEKNIFDSDILLNKNILIVDDDSRNIFTLSSILQDVGAEVQTALNGQEALNILHDDCDIDIVLMDIMMPIMNGLEAMKEIRDCKECKHVPIIAVSAKITKADEKLCYEAGADDFVAKPIDNNLLIKKIKTRIF